MTDAIPEIRTSRLLLRPFERADVPALVRLAGTKEIAATTLNIPHPYTEEDALKFLEKIAEDRLTGASVNFAISPASTRELCGAIGLRIAGAHQNAELGYWIAAPHWGKGYATEAAAAVIAFGFETLGLERIYAHYFAGNDASKRVLEKIGMKYEGRFRRHIRKWGEFIDIENYGLLRTDPPTR